ncbi:hypothetical protein K435DRAFT_220792 [Dendrothele bispora CBS 962.96]|uniref:Mid2 domain-containing protein n=1 Tax=Dendrothele bispora (strain CBS 962.96) TaxID=1314807 RepID=A0A4S8MME8_DENBC|nr:hypothetical protein K435DRAFT_220792 [Dendrothele bispora CBS 962.96]
MSWPWNDPDGPYHSKDFTFSVAVPQAPEQTAPVTLTWNCGKGSFCSNGVIIGAVPLPDRTTTQELVTLDQGSASGTTNFQISQTASGHFAGASSSGESSSPSAGDSSSGASSSGESSSSSAGDSSSGANSSNELTSISLTSTGQSLPSSSVSGTANDNSTDRSNDQKSSSNKTGAIVGGVVGGVLLLLLLILLAIFIRKRRLNSSPHTPGTFRRDMMVRARDPKVLYDEEDAAREPLSPQESARRTSVSTTGSEISDYHGERIDHIENEKYVAL